MARFNFLANRTAPTEIPSKNIPGVRTRATAHDRYAGLRGHAYLTARRLDDDVTSAPSPQVPAFLFNRSGGQS